jgi:predicted nucleotidyltransferase
MKNTIELINELKRENLIKDYAIGGAIGVLKWVEPFFTRDLDIFIIPIKETKKEELINLTPVYEYLKQKGCHWKGQWIIIEGIPVDFIPVDALEREAVENAEEIEFEAVKTKVITPEYLIALFLKAGRDKDLRKIEMLLEQAEIDRGKLDRILETHGLTEKFVNLKKKRYER